MLKTLGLTLTLIARANLYDGYQLPAMSFIDNVSPTLNDKGTVAFKLLSFQDGQSGMVLIPKGQASELIYASNDSAIYLSDASLNFKNEVFFSEFTEEGPVGLYQYDESKQLHKHFDANDLYEFSAIGTPVYNKNGYCLKLTKGYEPRASREVHCYGDGELKKAFGEGQIVQKNLKASYLFTPGFNDEGDFAVKLRLGARGEIEDSRGDVIALIENSNIHVLAMDVDADPASDYVSFHNSVSLNIKGEVALVGVRKDLSSCLVLASKSKVLNKICEGENGVKEIEFFTMQINDQSSIAFRAIDEMGKRQIYLLKKNEAKPRALIGEGDSVPTDIGEDKIVFKQDFPGFSGNIDLNNNNEIVFHAILEESGAGIFVVSEEP